MRYLLSKLVPVPMRSTYGMKPDVIVGARWVQWRDRTWRYREDRTAIGGAS